VSIRNLERGIPVASQRLSGHLSAGVPDPVQLRQLDDLSTDLGYGSVNPPALRIDPRPRGHAAPPGRRLNVSDSYMNNRDFGGCAARNLTPGLFPKSGEFVHIPRASRPSDGQPVARVANPASAACPGAPGRYPCGGMLKVPMVDVAASTYGEIAFIRSL
jgi:hypothetical protein